jgi:hypothetical protein
MIPQKYNHKRVLEQLLHKNINTFPNRAALIEKVFVFNASGAILYILPVVPVVLIIKNISVGSAGSYPASSPLLFRRSPCFSLASLFPVRSWFNAYF